VRDVGTKVRQLVDRKTSESEFQDSLIACMRLDLGTPVAEGYHL
jgi:hypothetical protein